MRANFLLSSIFLKLNNVSQTSSKRFVETPPNGLSFIHWILLLGKLKLLCLSKLVIIVLQKNTRKLINHLKQAQKSISNLSNFKTIDNCLPWTKN